MLVHLASLRKRKVHKKESKKFYATMPFSDIEVQATSNEKVKISWKLRMTGWQHMGISTKEENERIFLWKTF